MTMGTVGEDMNPDLRLDMKKGMNVTLLRKSGGVLFGCVWGEDEHREYIYIGVGAMRD